MKTFRPSPLPLAVLALLTLSTAATAQMLVSPLPGQLPGHAAAPPPARAACRLWSVGPRPEPILVLDDGAVEEAREFFRARTSGGEVAPRVARLLNLKWHDTLKRAQRTARRNGKPILWIQALGDLRGYT